ncbi:MAG: mannose-1-phosphate guanylyltransferase [Planctomycetes bacterium]|nr:mannose-1-phosphate guanylyltransferase [Planctomycetota bacterium]
MALHAVIMAGGSGTRFWPASRARRPKQVLPLAHGVPLVRATVERLRGLCDAHHVWIVTNAAQAAGMIELLPDVPPDHVLVEPEARDTAPCVALAAATIAAVDAEATMIVLPADHVITPIDTFQQMLARGVALAADGETLVTFGIEPTFAATGYGYIECGDELDHLSPRARAVRRFREKPDQATAEQFVRSGAFSWNSGIFVWTTAAIRRAMRLGNAALADAGEAMTAAAKAGDAAALERAFRSAPRISIDYAVMEKADRIAVVTAAIRWDDVGRFPALPAIAPADAAGNCAVTAAGAAVLNLDARGNIVYAEGQRTVALFGVEDLVVVAVGDAVMVCPKDKAHDLKRLVEHVRSAGRADLL